MWYFEGKEFTDDMIGEHVGFVYLITDTVNSKYYIGKKLFTKSKTYQKNKKKRRKRVTSDWMKYYGSNDELKQAVKEHGTDKFFRNILRLCKSKSELAYYETKTIFEHDALLKPVYYNSWVSVRLNRNTLINIR